MSGRALLLAGIVLIGPIVFAQDRKPPQIDAETRKATLQSVERALSDSYVYPEKAKEIAGYLRKRAQEGAYDALIDPREFAGKIVADIRSVQDDKHLRVVYDPKLEEDIVKFISSKRGASEVSEADLRNDLANNFYFKKIEILPSNIGYVEFTGFAAPGPAARKTVHAAFSFVAHTDALIVDLRNNHGGNGTLANEIAGYFFPVRTYTGRNFNRLENAWSESFVENRKEITEGLVLDMPVYILTSDRTFSAAEGFAYVLQTLKKAVVIGETTQGGAHLTRSFSLGNGFVAFIPYMRGENALTKTDWEGTGVIPDILVDETACLAAAQNEILNKKLAAATDETGKRRILWLINFNKSKDPGVTVDRNALAKFAGRFAEFEVEFKADHLLFRDIHQPSQIPYKLVAITPTLFQAGNDYQIEFILDPDGLCNSIKVYWSDGWVEEVKRTK